MQLTTPEIKTVVHKILTLEDEVDDKKTQVKREKIPFEHFRGRKEVVEAIIGQIEIALVPTDKESPQMEDVQWVPFKEFKPSKELRVVGERHSDVVIDVSDKGRAAIAYCAKDYTGIDPNVSLETFEFLEGLRK